MTPADILTTIQNLLPRIKSAGTAEPILLDYAKSHNLAPAQLVKLAQTLNTARSVAWMDQNPEARGATVPLIDTEQLVQTFTTPDVLHKSATGLPELALHQLVDTNDSKTPAITSVENTPEEELTEEEEEFNRLADGDMEGLGDMEDEEKINALHEMHPEVAKDKITKYVLSKSYDKSARHFGVKSSSVFISNTLRVNQSVPNFFKPELQVVSLPDLDTRENPLEPTFGKKAGFKFNDTIVDERNYEELRGIQDDLLEEFSKTAAFIKQTILDEPELLTKFACDLHDSTGHLNRVFKHVVKSVTGYDSTREVLNNLTTSVTKYANQQTFLTSTKFLTADNSGLVHLAEEAAQSLRMVDACADMLKSAVGDFGGTTTDTSRGTSRGTSSDRGSGGRGRDDKERGSRKSPQDATEAVVDKFVATPAAAATKTLTSFVPRATPSSVVEYLTGPSDNKGALVNLLSTTFSPKKRQAKIDKSLKETGIVTNLQHMLLTDPILSEADPHELVSLFNDLQQSDPTLGEDANRLRFALREAMTYGGIPSQTAKTLTETNKAKQQAIEAADKTRDNLYNLYK